MEEHAKSSSTLGSNTSTGLPCSPRRCSPPSCPTPVPTTSTWKERKKTSPISSERLMATALAPMSSKISETSTNQVHPPKITTLMGVSACQTVAAVLTRLTLMRHSVCKNMAVYPNPSRRTPGWVKISSIRTVFFLRKSTQMTPQTNNTI